MAIRWICSTAARWVGLVWVGSVLALGGCGQSPETLTAEAGAAVDPEREKILENERHLARQFEIEAVLEEGDGTMGIDAAGHFEDEDRGAPPSIPSWALRTDLAFALAAPPVTPVKLPYESLVALEISDHRMAKFSSGEYEELFIDGFVERSGIVFGGIDSEELVALIEHEKSAGAANFVVTWTAGASRRVVYAVIRSLNEAGFKPYLPLWLEAEGAPVPVIVFDAPSVVVQ